MYRGREHLQVVLPFFSLPDPELYSSNPEFDSTGGFVMRQRIRISVQIAALMVAGMAPRIAAAQGNSVSLADQLRAQYTMVKMGADSSGPAVTDPGTILV